MAEHNQRESQIALIRASLEHLQSNILEAEKRLLQGKSEAEGVELLMSTYKEAAEKHAEVSVEISQLAMYVEKATTYPVIHERKKNAENQKADEILRLMEIEKELSEAEAELFNMSDVSSDISKIEYEISNITSRMAHISSIVAQKQQSIGSLKQKLEEIERLQKEVAIYPPVIFSLRCL